MITQDRQRLDKNIEAFERAGEQTRGSWIADDQQ
jgi:hypothetical protein